ncbi:OLC1v1029983C3 [Oldenlandia corymbosa var. corymbosa]|uniref:OLC1v1029983C3 n=1 Tax=Oldenlandia corymbosa var. corymbosa TaxID=529605 RepID=A0AAV1CGU3_OLDCO|nr:OLC1v1029983C3 [Oldenlandia corymbosa var. corymbosa]
MRFLFFIHVFTFGSQEKLYLPRSSNALSPTRISIILWREMDRWLSHFADTGRGGIKFSKWKKLDSGELGIHQSMMPKLLSKFFKGQSCLFNDPFPHKTCDYDNALSDLMSSKLRTFIPAQVSFEEACGNLARTRMLEEEVIIVLGFSPLSTSMIAQT